MSQGVPEIYKGLIKEPDLACSAEPEVDREESLFDRPVGVRDGVACDLGGEIKVSCREGGYSIESTRIPLTETTDLHTVVLGGGTATIEIDDGLTSVALAVHRKGGFTNITCGDNTAVIISSHGGFDILNGFVPAGYYDSADRERYTVIVPADKLDEPDVSWVENVVRVDQMGGWVTVSNGARELSRNKPDNIASGVGRRALNTP